MTGAVATASPASPGRQREVEAAPSRQHIRALDGLRGLAILSVMLFHCFVGNTEGKGRLLMLVGRSMRSGWIGVDLFFVLPGFLITGILLDTATQPGYFRNFYIRRSLRIFPLYYGVLFALLVITPLLKLNWHGNAAFFLLYLQNYRPLDTLVIQGPVAWFKVEHLWSLAVEEQFYLLWPAIVWIFRGRKSFVFVPLALVVICPLLRIWALHRGLDRHDLYFWTPFRLDALAWGAIAALLQRFAAPVNRMRLCAVLGVTGLVATVWVAVLHRGMLDQYESTMISVGYPALGMMFFAVVLLVVEGKAWIVKPLLNRQLRWIGKLSYGIYVYHILFTPGFYAARRIVGQRTGSAGLGSLTEVVLTFGVGILCAWISYNVYEKRWLRLKDVIAAYKWQPSRPKTLST